MNLSERIRLILDENHLKQKELAKETGVTESYISAILNGEEPKMSTLGKTEPYPIFCQPANYNSNLL
ncbi:MAG: helix-turn-helix transcriptional regulator [Lachnospiraceae bacterium]